jgi:TRAP-type C4-dicarboxylate transport system substrate-binding protein
MEGLKIRLPEEKVLIRTFQLIKAAPTIIPWGEVYTSLQTGIVDGMESTTPAIYTMKFYEVAQYLAETNHQHAVVQLLISDKVFQSLSKEMQDVLRQAARETLEINYQEARLASQKSWDLLRAKAKQTTYPDLRPFQDAVQPLYKEFGDQTKTGEIIRQIEGIQ